MRVGVILFFWSLQLVVPQPVNAQTQPDKIQCWSPKALAAKSSERIIRRGGKEARVNAPNHPPRSLPPVAAKFQGSIRHVKLPPGKKLLALTFDLCESSFEVAGYEGRIVDYLRKYGIKATFFVGGHWLSTHKTRAMQLTADPLFEIGNHSWSHANLRTTSGKQLESQISKAQAAYEDTVEDLAQQDCFLSNPEQLEKIPQQMKLFRFPYGSCSRKALKSVAQSGLLAIQWNIATGDPARAQSARRIARTVLARAKPGSIIIAHANGRGWHSARALPLFIPKLRARGYEFVTISELLAAGTPVIDDKCYSERPGDTRYYEPKRKRRANKRKSTRRKKRARSQHFGPWEQERD